jgi:exonuclease III
LFPNYLSPFITSVSSSTPGRAISLNLEIGGSKLTLVSIYLPSGLDFAHNNHENVRSAAEILAKLLTSLDPSDAVIVAMDANCTMDARDRILASDQSTVYPGRTLGCLVEEGFIDSFRHFHDYGGLTFSIGREGARSLVSRLDQIWIRGVTLENSSVSDPPTSSDHLLLKLLPSSPWTKHSLHHRHQFSEQSHWFIGPQRPKG